MHTDNRHHIVDGGGWIINKKFVFSPDGDKIEFVNQETGEVISTISVDDK